MIVKAAIKDADGNIWDVPQPGRHSDVFDLIYDNEIKRQGNVIKRPKPECGFVDEAGKFYDRYEAAKHAVECGQQFYLYSPVNPTEERFAYPSPSLPFPLFSEDLW